MSTPRVRCAAHGVFVRGDRSLKDKWGTLRSLRRTTTAIAVAGAAALTVTMTTAGPAVAGPLTAAAKPARTAQAPQAARTGHAAPATHDLTLVTGDRVLLDAHGKAVGLRPAKGRESVLVSMTELKGDSYVIPADVGGLVSDGSLDLRLFDVTELSRTDHRQLTGSGVPLIVTYGSRALRATARARLRTRPGTAVRADLRAVNGEAVTVSADGTAVSWSALTRPSAHGRTLAPGVRSLRLDGLLKTQLDVSFPQIGAPAAWAAGYDGKGVKVAVLDSGIDLSRPDLASQVVASANFSNTPDALDHYGHGTHVASIVAGTGAESGGKYKGVAPGAQLLNGKVTDNYGIGTESAIIAGMQWAVDQGAKVVNLSLGGPDSPGVDPLEETVNRLSDKALFVIAAGNSGPRGTTVAAPGSVSFKADVTDRDHRTFSETVIDAYLTRWQRTTGSVVHQPGVRRSPSTEAPRTARTAVRTPF